ncbi:MAG TPA: kelch repeat-containing protein [Burkholderiaceae bacterium]|nr:kelch repeat-containing protein [Burkholderiaceae bacterium]
MRSPLRATSAAMPRRWLRGMASSLLGSMLACSAAAQGTWSKLTTSGPAMSARSSPAVAAIVPHIYLFGGVNDDLSTSQFVFFNDLHRFDTLTHRWTLLAPSGAIPPPRTFAAGVALPHRHLMLVFGGATFRSDDSSMTAFDDLWAYDVQRNEWSQLHPGNIGPAGRASASMWQRGERIYVFGGVDAGLRALNDLWVFDLGTRRWTLLTPGGAAGSPPARFQAYAGAEAVLSKLTVYGGLAGADQGFAPRGDTWQFNVLTSTWSDVTPATGNISPVRNDGAAAHVGLSLYVQGGETPGGTSGCGSMFPQNPSAELWRYSLLRRTWEPVTPQGDALPHLKRSAAAAVAGRMYVFAGFDFACANGLGGQVWNDSVYSYSPASLPGVPQGSRR